MNNTHNNNEIRMFDIKEAKAYVGLGDSKAAEFLKEIGAVRRIGKRVLYDKRIIDEYFDNLSMDTIQ